MYDRPGPLALAGLLRRTQDGKVEYVSGVTRAVGTIHFHTYLVCGPAREVKYLLSWRHVTTARPGEEAGKAAITQQFEVDEGQTGPRDSYTPTDKAVVQAFLERVKSKEPTTKPTTRRAGE
jgi:hypothetical protein